MARLNPRRGSGSGGWEGIKPPQQDERSFSQELSLSLVSDRDGYFICHTRREGKDPLQQTPTLQPLSKERLLGVMKNSQVTRGLLVLSAPGGGVARSPREGMLSLPEKGIPKSLTNLPCRGKLPGGQESHAQRK